MRLSREEFIEADLKLENSRQKLIDVSKQAQETIATERRRRIDAEDEARQRSEVVFFVIRSKSEKQKRI